MKIENNIINMSGNNKHVNPLAELKNSFKVECIISECDNMVDVLVDFYENDDGCVHKNSLQMCSNHPELCGQVISDKYCDACDEILERGICVEPKSDCYIHDHHLIKCNVEICDGVSKRYYCIDHRCFFRRM